MAAIDTFEFAFEPRYTRWLRLAGITPETTLVTVTEDEFRVRFGGWKLITPIANCTGTCLTEGANLARPVTEVAAVDGVCLCLARSTLEAVQGFDESYGFFHGYDRDLSFAVRETGRACVVIDAPFMMGKVMSATCWPAATDTGVPGSSGRRAP